MPRTSRLTIGGPQITYDPLAGPSNINQETSWSNRSPRRNRRSSQHVRFLDQAQPHEANSPDPFDRLAAVLGTTTPADRMKNFDQFCQTQPHSEIYKSLENVEIGQICPCSQPKKKHTILATLMANATNFGKIIRNQLDECVTVSDNMAEDENDPGYGARIDFGPIFRHKKGLIKDILSHGHKRAQEVLNHPVIETFLYIQNKSKRNFVFKGLLLLLYVIFLIFHYVYVCSVLYWRKSEVPTFRTFPNAFTNGHGAEATYGLITVLTLTMLLFLEAFQIYIFRKRYFKRLDAWLKLVVYFLSICSLFFSNDKIRLKYISVISMPLAWFTLILTLSYQGSTISVMFLHILHKRFIIGAILAGILSTSVGTGLQLISFQEGDSFNLSLWIRSSFRPLMMILGEFEYNAMHEQFQDDYWDLFYASSLLLIFAMAGTLVLVNLLLGLVVSDINHLHKICHQKELFRMANQAVFLENLAHRLGCFKFFQKHQETPGVITVCLHDFCSCANLKVSHTIKVRLRHVLKKKVPGDFSRPHTAGTTDCVIDEIL